MTCGMKQRPHRMAGNSPPFLQSEKAYGDEWKAGEFEWFDVI